MSIYVIAGQTAESPPYSGKRQVIVEAAMEVFARYGLARTTMADLAKAAGMARTALYPIFRNKGDVFDAVIRHATAQTVIAIRAGLGDQATLAEKLHYACEDWVVRGYDYVHAMPDARDLFDIALPTVRDAYREMEGVIAEILAPYAAGSSVDERMLARIMTSAFRSFKEIAVDTDDLRHMVSIQLLLIETLITSITTRGGVALEDAEQPARERPTA